jgi:ABC-type oligopeptide transport system, ATPase component
MDIMQVKDLTFIHNERKRWLKRPEIFQLGPVNLSVKRGETIAIIGENRSGKSLLAKLLVGALPADAGEIELTRTNI